MPGDDVRIHLLYGLLAVRLDLVDVGDLLPALRDWAAGGKARPIGGVLHDRGALDGPTRDLLERLTDRHLRAHGGDPVRSLAALGPFPGIEAWLLTVEDEELRTALERLADAPTQFAPDVAGAISAIAPAGPANSTVMWDASGPQVDEGMDWDEPEPPYGRYTILKAIARGGLGEVYLARDEGLNRTVALKVIVPRLAGNALCRARFRIEAEVTAALDHPGVVPVHVLGRCEDGRAFYCMRLIRGEDLPDAVARYHAETRRPARARLLIGLLRHFIDVCNIVAYAHSRGVIHRDIKPGNIRLGRYGETFLVDWGLAKHVGRPEPRARDLASDSEPTLEPAAGSGVTPTAIGATVGTPGYMSPEQANGDLDHIGIASDVYGLGATLYFLLCGRAPLGDERDVADVLTRTSTGDIPPPRRYRPDASTTLETICLKAMALRPEDRYSSARTLADDVECWLADLPTSVPERLGRRLGRWERRHRVLIRVAGAALLAAWLALILAHVR